MVKSNLQAEVQRKLDEEFPALQLKVFLDERNIATLTGECDTWNTLIDAGHLVGHVKGIHSVVSDMTVKGMRIPQRDYTLLRKDGRALGTIAEADVVIAGAGITGCGIARELSKYNLKVIVCEKGEDVAIGATRANNGDIHPGYLEKPGYQKVALNVKGNKMYDQWAQELHFTFNRCGNMVVITDEKYRPQLEDALKQSQENGVYAEIVDRKRALELEPSMLESGVDPVAALYVPSMAIVAPWEVTVALAENAVHNGVKILLDCEVVDVECTDSHISSVVTSKGIIRTKYLINCAGTYADDISAMAQDRCFTLHPRKGTILIFDKDVKPYKHLFRMIDEQHKVNKKVSSKGGGMGTTYDENILLGPSAIEVPDKEDKETSRGEIDFCMSRNCKKELGYKDIIRIFSGTRPATFTEDFFIEASPKTFGLINVAGIQSPGLSSAPAIAELAIHLLEEKMALKGEKLTLKADFDPIRPKSLCFSQLSHEEQHALIAKDPAYGRVVCRCETITEGEILDVIHSNVVPTTVDAIKRRTRAGMGRCQGGFCQIRVIELLARELGKSWVDINLHDKGSNILLKDNRE